MTQRFPHRLERAVMAICPDIEARVAAPRAKAIDDRALWWELSCCILSSQVPFTVATAAAEAIDRAGLLLAEHVELEGLASELEDVLANRVAVGSRSVRYRFPSSRAHQLASTHALVHRHGGSMSALLAQFDDAAAARRWLVDNVPGAGPKQASMFLRNIGMSYSLAILDRHVLNYMSALGIGDHAGSAVAGLPTYLRLEDALRGHAKHLGYAVGLLDWAIWIVMRADKEQNLELDFA